MTSPSRGSGFVRPLAQTARKMGVEILLKQRMTTIHREQPLSGRVTGITAIEVDDWFQPTGKSINIRARKGIIVASGGCADNVQFRTMFDVRLTDEYQAENSGWSKRTADGEIAAMQIGASLGATACQTTEDDNLLTKGRMGAKSNGTSTVIHPTSPHFFRARAVGLAVRDYQNVILVKENGLRFHTETAGQRDHKYFSAALAWTGDPKKMNGGGPIWAIFDADAVAREKWQVKPPYVDPEGYFFSADTIEELAKKIVNEYQWRPMPPAALRKTVERYNSFVDTGKDADFKKPKPMFKIDKPPFYAAWHTPAIHDTYTGHPNQHPGAGHRPARQADTGPLCLRRCIRRIRSARHLPRGDIRAHRRASRRQSGHLSGVFAAAALRANTFRESKSLRGLTSA